MKSYRENPECEANRIATKQNEREIFAAKMAATIRENRIVDNPRAEHWKKAYDEMADIAMMMLDALCVIRDKADPYTHQIHWCRQKAAETVEKANAAFRSNEKVSHTAGRKPENEGMK